MKPSLKNPKLKIERSKEHLDVLYSELIKFLDTKPCRITTKEDAQNALYIMRIHMPTIDSRLAILAGDAIDNLRSALDHIAWQLALTNGGRPHNRTAFPVVDVNTTEKMRTFSNVTRDITAEAVNEIKALQPYLRGASYQSDLLWKLDKLCNINKHRVVPAECTSLDFKIPKGIKPTFGTLNDEYIVEMPIAVKAQMQFAPPPTYDIVLGSKIDGCVISIWELSDIYKYVRDNVLPRFTRFFPK